MSGADVSMLNASIQLYISASKSNLQLEAASYPSHTFIAHLNSVVQPVVLLLLLRQYIVVSATSGSQMHRSIIAAY